MFDAYSNRPPSPSNSAATSASNQREAGHNRGPGSPTTVNLMSGGDNIRVCARFRPLNRVEESINAHLAISGVRDSAFNCVRFPSESRDRVEIKVPDALLTAVERHEQSGRSDDGFVTDITSTFGGNPRSEGSSFIARSPSSSSMSALQNYVSNSYPLGSSPSANVSTHSMANNNAFNSASSYSFNFDHVFDPHVSQDGVYQEVGAPIVEDVMLGYNGTIFVYGQTGSGKTFSMMGAPLPNAPVLGERGRQGSVVSNSAGTPRRGGNTGAAGPFSPGGYQNPRNQPYSSSQALQAPPAFDLLSADGSGIIPRAVNHLFESMYASPDTVSYTVSLFFVEIYMEKVRDLLVPDPSQSNLSIREDPKSSSFYIEGCVMADVTSPEEIFQLLNYGIQNRATASTKMNTMSSRSHCLLCVAVHAFDSELGEQRIGKLFLVDLAGSEKVAKTKAEGQQLEEAKVINKSLTALGHVINQLSHKAPHIPYRDSKLTKILQDALGGNSKTALIVCCSPSVRNIHETLSTLRFGQRAKTVKNRAVINKQFTVEELKVMLAAAKVEIDSLRKIGPSPSPTVGLISNHSVLEDRFVEEKKALIANIHSMEDALRDAHEAADAEAEGRLRLERLVSQLKEEIRLWEGEYVMAKDELQAATQGQSELSRQLSAERDAMSTLQQQTAARKTEVARLRELAQRAVENMQSEGDELHSSNVSLQQQVASLKRKNKKLAESNALLLQEANRREEEFEKERRDASEKVQHLQQNSTVSTRNSSPLLTSDVNVDGRALSVATSDHSSPLFGTMQLQGDDILFDRSNSMSAQMMAAGLKHQLDSSRATAAATNERLKQAEKQREEMDSAMTSLRNENEMLALRLQEVTKKLAIRTEQCDNFTNGFAIQNERYEKSVVTHKNEKGELKIQILQARSDSAYWRNKAGAGNGHPLTRPAESDAQNALAKILGNRTSTTYNQNSLVDFISEGSSSAFGNPTRLAASKVLNRNAVVGRRTSADLGVHSGFISPLSAAPTTAANRKEASGVAVYRVTTDDDSESEDGSVAAGPSSVTRLPKSPSPTHHIVVPTAIAASQSSAPVIRGGSNKGSPSHPVGGATSTSPSPNAPDRPVGLVNVNLASYLVGSSSAAAPFDLASPLMGSSTIRVGAGGFGAPPYYHLAPTGDVVGDVPIAQGSAMLTSGSIKGRQPSSHVYSQPRDNSSNPFKVSSIDEFMGEDGQDSN